MSRVPSTTALLTSLALAAFAGNSVLCRMALRDAAIDPWSFTALRLASGALLLAPLLRSRSGAAREPWRPLAGAALLAYALAFSLAYGSLAAGTCTQPNSSSAPVPADSEPYASENASA